MSWEWSHTNEAYEAAKSNLQSKDRDFLEVAYCEWVAMLATVKNENLDWLEVYNAEMQRVKEMQTESLIDHIWERASELRTSDNGGFNAYMCPDGCHTVSFSN